MASTPDKFARKRARTSAISTVVGISLVLFMLGMLAVLILNGQKLSSYVKENIQVQVFLKEDVKEGDLMRIKKEMDAEPFVKETTIVSKEEAARVLSEDLGEDFVSFLGYNPLPASIDMKLQAEYAHPDSVEIIASNIEDRKEVAEVVYSPNLLREINRNINRLSLILLGFSILLLIVAIALINNTIRLAIYSKRFIIRSMQLVGATGGFIQRPFIWNGIIHGLYAGFIAVILIMGILFLAKREVPEFFEVNDFIIFVKVFAVVLISGIIISGISTLFAVRRYLRTDAEKIY
jgi:cell division transport system permease protein